MTASDPSLRLAIRNIALWGDTDVLPFPLENHWFHDAEDQVLDVLRDLDSNFKDWLESYPVQCERILANVGYVGYRSVSQVDPIWNAYLLALSIEIAPDIESARLAPSKNIVHSYRFVPDTDTNTLFAKSWGWHSCQQEALSRASTAAFVVSTDISDFYPRVYHHRIHHAIDAATSNKEAVRRIDILLSSLSLGGVSYGLPIGGNAARILAEALLDRTDRLLLSRNVRFCRFVDDYYLFAQSEEEARRALVHLSDSLLTHEGMTLSRIKTRIMSGEEFRKVSPAAPPEQADAETEAAARGFLRIRLKYDPYSPTAAEDYERLKSELSQFDIVGMLARELRKSRIDEALTRQLVKALRYLTPAVRADAVESLVDNLHVLFPIFPTVAIVMRAVLDEIAPEVREKLFTTLRGLIQDRSHIFQVETNLAYAVRLLARDRTDEADIVLAQGYDSATSMLIRREIILAMAVRGSTHWVADRLRSWSTLQPWEQRALIPASYTLRDEGAHWRRRRRDMNEVDKAFTKWCAAKNDGVAWTIPL